MKKRVRICHGKMCSGTCSTCGYSEANNAAYDWWYCGYYKEVIKETSCDNYFRHSNR